MAMSMLSPRQLRFAFLPLMLLALSVLMGLAVVAFREALAAGAAEVWMMAWLLAFVVGLPLLLVLLPVVEALRARGSRSAIVPLAGGKIPGAGQ